MPDEYIFIWVMIINIFVELTLTGNKNLLGIEINKYSHNKNNNYDSLPVKNGKGIYKKIGGAVGYSKWGGLIKLKAPEGGTDLLKPFRGEYQVAPPILVVSPTKLNLFYIGVDNPVEISVPGVSPDKIFPSINNGTIRKEGNGYIVNPARAGQMAQVTV